MIVKIYLLSNQYKKDILFKYQSFALQYHTSARSGSHVEIVMSSEILYAYYCFHI